MRTPLATASAVKNSFSFSEPSHQKTWSGSQSFVFSSTHASKVWLVVLQFPKGSFVIVLPIRPEPKPNGLTCLLKDKIIFTAGIRGGSVCLNNPSVFPMLFPSSAWPHPLCAHNFRSQLLRKKTFFYNRLP